MKKNIIRIIGIIAILLVLFLPIPKGVYKDGGTRDYMALTYRVVVWNRLLGEGNDVYHKTSVYWIPDKFKSIDELWEIEQSKNH